MKYSKGLTIAGFIIVTAILLIAVSGPILSFYIKKSIEKNKSIQIENIHLNILFGSVQLDKIKLTDAILNEAKVTGVIKSVHIKHSGWIKYLLRNDVSIGSISISEALLSVEQMPGDSSEPVSANKNVPSIVIDEIEISNSNLKASTFKKDSLMLSIELLTLDHIEYINSTLFLKELSFRFGETFYLTANGQYQMGWIKAVCLPGENKVVFDSISVIPALETQMFFEKAKYQTDRISLVIPETKLFTPTTDFKSDNYVFNGSATFRSGYLQVTRDKNISRKENDLKPTLQEVLKSSPLSINFDSLIFQSFRIRYSEIAENETLSGSVTFDSLDATLLHVKTGEVTDGKLLIDAQAIFMNEGKLNARFEFPYRSNYFDCTGSIINLNFVQLNLVSEPLAKVAFSNGKIDKLMFNFRADADSSRGDLLFYYSNLNFAIASNTKGETSNLKSRVLSFIADDLIVSDGNPNNNGDVSKGIIREARNKERFIFNYMWKSVFSGIKSTVLNNARKENKSRWKR